MIEAKRGRPHLFGKLPMNEMVKALKNERALLLQTQAVTVFLNSGIGEAIHAEVGKQILVIDKVLERFGHIPKFGGV